MRMMKLNKKSMTGLGIILLFGVLSILMILGLRGAVAPGATGYLDPNGDGNNLQWSLSSGSAHFSLINKTTRQPIAPDTTDYIYTTNPSSGYTDIINFSTINGTTSVSSITIWAYAFTDITAYINISLLLSSAWTSWNKIVPTGSGASWYSSTYTGTWTQTDLDNLQINLTDFKAAPSISPTKIYSLYAEVNYTYNSGLSSDPTSIDSWPMFMRQLNHTGHTSANSPANISNVQVNIFANTTARTIASSPVVANGYLYVGSDDDQVYQLNATNISQIIANFSAGGDVLSSPAIAGNYVYVTSFSKQIYQLNATNISLLIANYSFPAPLDYSSPAVSNDYVYIGCEDQPGNTFYQLNASNVSQLVQVYNTGSDIDTSSPAIANGNVYIGEQNYNFYQLNASDVSQKLYDLNLPFTPTGASAMVAEGSVFFNMYTPDSNFYQLNASNISQIIANVTPGTNIAPPTSFPTSTPAYANGYIYFGRGDNKIYQLNATNISQIIASYTTGDDVISSPAIANNYVYIGSNDGYLYQLNATNISQAITRYQTGGAIQSSPAISNGSVYVGSNDGKLYQFTSTPVSGGADTTSPYFVQAPANTTIAYGTQFKTQLNASDETSLSCFAVNDTRFAVNCSGYLYNFSSLSGGLYTLNLTINDTSNNLNSTYFWVNVSKINSEIRSYINHSIGNFSANLNNANNTWLNATLINGTGEITLYLNGSIINSGTSPLSNLTNLTTGYYNLTALYSGNANYTNSASWLWLNITAPIPDLTPPNFTSITENQSYSLVNQNTNFSSIVADNVLVNRAWLMHNFDLTDLLNIKQVQDYNYIGFGKTTQLSQTFRFNQSLFLREVCFKIYYSGGTKANITINLHAVSANKPAGRNLTSSIVINKDSINSTIMWRCINFTKPYKLSKNTYYSIVLSSPSSSSASTYRARYGKQSSYEGTLATSSNSGNAWTIQPSDLMFNFTAGDYSWKNESLLQINSDLKSASLIKKLNYAHNSLFMPYFSYKWCANDSSNNINCSSTRSYFVYENSFSDLIYPAGSILSPPNNTKINGNVTLDGAASDNIGLDYASIQYMNSTTSWRNITGCEELQSPFDCVWNSNLFSNETLGYNIRIVPCDIAGNCNTTTSIKHYVIDRLIPIDSAYIVYPGTQSSARNSQNLTLKINVTDASGAGINSTAVFTDLTLVNGTGNSSMARESGSAGAGLWSTWNITALLSGTTTGLQAIPYYVSDNATPTNNILHSVFLVQMDNNKPTYDSFNYTPVEPIYNNTNVTFQINAFDNFNLSYAIFASNFTGSWRNSTINFENPEDDWASNTSMMATGNYSYYFVIYDNAGNSNTTTARNIQIHGPEPLDLNISLTSPVEEAVLIQTNVTFSYNYTGGTALTCNLFIDSALNSSAINPAIDSVLYFQQNLSDSNYTWFVLCNNSQGNDYASEIRSFVIDAAAPAITNIASSVSSSTATITWDTDELANSSVYYGLNTNVSYNFSSSSLVISHSVTLSSLSALTFYYYNISSCDSLNHCNISIQYNFTTSKGDDGDTSCFPSGTKIIMADKSWKNIEDVKIGDKVLSFNFDKNKQEGAKVLELEMPVRREMCEIIFSDLTSLKLTSEHPIYTNEGWKSINPEETEKENSELKVNKLAIGDNILDYYGNYKEIIKINCFSQIIRTYNLESIEKNNNFYADNILVHNKGGGGGGDVCNATCSSKGYVCGSVCGKNCGNCSIGTCKNGRCVKSNCTENWICSNWSLCSNEEKTRICWDLNACGSEDDKPKIKDACENQGCSNWTECEYNPDLKNLASKNISNYGIQERECYNINSGKYDIETRECSLAKDIVIKKINWCYQDYLEIYDKNSGKMVGMVKQHQLANLTKLDIRFTIANKKGACDFCFDKIKNYDELEIDCGGSCRNCLIIKGTRFKILSNIYWLWWILLLLLIILLLYYFKKEHEDRKIIVFVKKLEHNFK